MRKGIHKLSVIICTAFLCAVSAGVTGCGEKNSTDSTQGIRETETSVSENTKATQAPTEAKTKVDTSWKQAYSDYVVQTLTQEGWSHFQYIYLDNDDIPELVAVGEYEAQGNKIITYKDGKVTATQLSRMYFTYIPKSGLLNNSDGNMDEYYDIVYQLKNGTLTKIHRGDWGAKDNSKLEFDANGNVIYQYKWDGVTMSEQEYKKKLNAVYDTSKAEEGVLPDNTFTAAQIVDIIHDL